MKAFSRVPEWSSAPTRYLGATESDMGLVKAFSRVHLGRFVYADGFREKTLSFRSYRLRARQSRLRRKQQGHPAKATRHHLQQEMSPMYPCAADDQVLSAAARSTRRMYAGRIANACMQEASLRPSQLLPDGNIGSMLYLTSINFSLDDHFRIT